MVCRGYCAARLSSYPSVGKDGGYHEDKGEDYPDVDDWALYKNNIRQGLVIL